MINLFMKPLLRLTVFTEMYQRGMAGFQRFYEIMEMKPEIINQKDTVVCKKIRGEIEFDNLVFGYSDQKKVIKGFNLKIAPGQTVAFVGETGAGKTTIASLLLRFYDPLSGRILVDGIDIRQYKQQELRRNIGIVQQDVFLFSDSVTHNIAYAKPEAEQSEVENAARLAAADKLIDAGTAFDLSAMPKVHQEKVAWGTEDFTQGPAMTVEQAEKALKVGMKVADECIDKGYNLLVTAEMGIGNTTSTAAIVSAFLGLPPELTVGRGTGINDERMAIKRKVVADGLAKNQPRLGDAMDILCKVGGYDHAGLAGMILAGARRRIPTMVDGVNATAAALLAYGLEPACADYMLCSHLSAEISHAKMLEVLRLTPIVDAGMRLGEGTGASLAIVILQMAINTYKELYKRGGMHA